MAALTTSEFREPLTQDLQEKQLHEQLNKLFAATTLNTTTTAQYTITKGPLNKDPSRDIVVNNITISQQVPFIQKVAEPSPTAGSSSKS